VPAAAASALCGWLLGEGGHYEPSLLEWHERTGIAVAVGCAVLFLLHWLSLQRAYRLGLALTCGLLVVASHFGGSLTHGRDHLTRYAPEPFRSWLGGSRPAASPSMAARGSQQAAFGAIVQPILQQYCVSCHGPEKVKARLRLDSFEALERGSEHGAVVQAGNASASRLFHAITLPPDDDAHMPPLGKPQPGADDLALLRWWIDGGASATARVDDLKAPAEIARLLESRLR
jgi:hypothetical protein